MATNKVFHKTVISTEEQDIEIYPTETFDGIIVQVKEMSGELSPRFYLNQYEMNLLIDKMSEMMNYVKS